MSDFPNARDCQHGRLRRSCEQCDLEDEVRTLREALTNAQGVLVAVRAEVRQDSAALSDTTYADVLGVLGLIERTLT